jgi:hypothetical protein
MFAEPSVVDSCEHLLPTAGHYLTANNIVTPDNATTDITTHYLNVIVLQSATNRTYVNVSVVAASNFVAIGTSGYYGAQVPISAGTNTVTSSQSVGVEVYGWGITDAYGYLGGVVK